MTTSNHDDSTPRLDGLASRETQFATHNRFARTRSHKSSKICVLRHPTPIYQLRNAPILVSPATLLDWLRFEIGTQPHRPPKPEIQKVKLSGVTSLPPQSFFSRFSLRPQRLGAVISTLGLPPRQTLWLRFIKSTRSENRHLKKLRELSPHPPESHPIHARNPKKLGEPSPTRIIRVPPAPYYHLTLYYAGDRFHLPYTLKLCYSRITPNTKACHYV
jgi:hypothetical protein